LKSSGHGTIFKAEVKGSGFGVQLSELLNLEPLNLYRFDPSTLNGEWGTFEPISLQSFNPERGTMNL
jgi:hypothetical protein